jgi:hypothetical protein
MGAYSSALESGRAPRAHQRRNKIRGRNRRREADENIVGHAGEQDDGGHHSSGSGQERDPSGPLEELVEQR